MLEVLADARHSVADEMSGKESDHTWYTAVSSDMSVRWTARTESIGGAAPARRCSALKQAPGRQLALKENTGPRAFGRPSRRHSHGNRSVGKATPGRVILPHGLERDHLHPAHLAQRNGGIEASHNPPQCRHKAGSQPSSLTFELFSSKQLNMSPTNPRSSIWY